MVLLVSFEVEEQVFSEVEEQVFVEVEEQVSSEAEEQQAFPVEGKGFGGMVVQQVGTFGVVAEDWQASFVVVAGTEIP